MEKGKSLIKIYIKSRSIEMDSNVRHLGAPNTEVLAGSLLSFAEEIDGIESVSVGRYCAKLEIARMFEASDVWGEMQKQIEQWIVPIEVVNLTEDW